VNSILLIDSADPHTMLTASAQEAAALTHVPFVACTDDCRALFSRSQDFCVVMINTARQDAIHVASDFYRRNPESQFILVTSPGQNAFLEQLASSTMLGNNWTVVRKQHQDLAWALSNALAAYEQRSRYRTALS